MGIVRAAFTVGVFTLFSRLAGFVRECVMAYCLGAGLYSDALLIALRISNTFRRIFAEGAFNASFLPRFSKVLNNEGKDHANIVLSDVFSLLLMILSVFTVIVIIFFPTVLSVLVSGFDEVSKKFGLTVTLGRICFPYLILISITSLFCGVLNTINNFALPAAVYSLLSIFTAIGIGLGYCLKCSDFMIVHIASVCVLLSGIAQSCLLYSSICKHGFHVRFRFKCWSERVSDIMKNMIPGIIGAGVWQLNLLIDTTIASYLPTGTITCVNLADRLNQFPLGTLGIALSTALLPTLAKFISTNQYDRARAELEKGLLFAFFLAFFSTSLLLALSEQSVAVAFQRGMFESEQVKITASAVTGFAIGLPAYVLTKVFASVFFATGDTKSPVIFAMISVVLNVMFLALLVPFLKYFGLALCTSLSAISNATLLIYFSRRKLHLNFSKNFWIKILFQIISALVAFYSLRVMADAFWTCELGNKSIKWGIYLGFLLVAIAVYSITDILCLRVAGQKQWRIWTRDAWA